MKTISLIILSPLLTTLCAIILVFKICAIVILIRQVYNGPRASNLSQQQQQKILVKNNFEQKNKKIFPKKLFGKNLEKQNLGKMFF